ncbi:MAG: FtsH protease activity modulator HflK [Candidatus Eutrophobiaceae bacterium]
MNDPQEDSKSRSVSSSRGDSAALNWNGKDDGGGRNNGWGGGKSSGPPDLEEILSKAIDRLMKFLGLKENGKKPPERPSSSSGDNFAGSPKAILAGLGVLLTLWLFYDITHIVDQQQRGVVLRFGQHVATIDPGLSFRLPRPIERVLLVNTGQVRSITHKATMLTQDENIVEVEVAVQWRKDDPEGYLFNVYEPETTLKQVTESVVREVIGKSKLDFIFTEGRNQIASREQELIQETLDGYGIGILILGVEMQPANPPNEVKAAFDDAIKAREDKERLINDAEAYRNDIIPKARGMAARLREEAGGYKARKISEAEGEASRFDQMLTEYKRAPEVTRQRLYIEAMESVLANSNKILLGSDAGNNSLIYLPIDKMIEYRRDEHQDSNLRSNNKAGGSPATTTQQEASDNIAPGRWSDRRRTER